MLAVIHGKSNHLEENQLISIHQTLHQVLASRLELNEKVAVRQYSDGKSILFGQLQRKADQLAARLSHCIVWPLALASDRIIGVCLPPSIDLIVGLLAIFKIGAAYLPIDVSYPPERVAYILNDAHPVLLLSCGSIVSTALFSKVDHNLPVFDIDTFQMDQVEIPIEKYLLKNFQPVIQGDQLAVVLYTSGSTGIPKGVRLKHRNILYRLNWQWRTFPYAENEVSCFKTALTFVDSIAEIWAPLLKTEILWIVPKDITQNAEAFIEFLNRCNISRLILVPSLLKAILDLLSTCFPKQDRLQSAQGKIIKNNSLIPFLKSSVAYNKLLLNIFTVPK